MTIEKYLIDSFFQLLSNGDVIEQLFKTPHHTALDAAQDILDACDHGQLSIQGARNAVNAILDDLEGRTEPLSDRASRVQKIALSLQKKGKLNMTNYLKLRDSLSSLPEGDLAILEARLSKL